MPRVFICAKTIEIFGKVCYNIIDMDKATAKQYNAATLAFLGDAVFTQYVRETLVRDHDEKSGGLHKIASSYVCAHAQSVAYEAILPSLTDEEADVARRARNCHTSSRAKNAIVGDYRRATALEGLFGYLKLIGDDARLNDLMAVAVRAIDETRRPRG